MSSVEGDRDRVNESSHLPPTADSAVLSSILALAPLSVVGYDDAGHIVLWNVGAERLLGWRTNEVLGAPPPYPWNPASGASLAGVTNRPTREGGIARMSVRTQRIALANGATVLVELGTDLEDRTRLEHQIVQSVKLEAVARLAGGIAHDFNNILAAISCSCVLLADSLAPEDARSVDVRAISEASARAADLTRQLLAFTRQQVMLPQIVDLNAMLRASERILRGVAGKELTLTLDLSDDPVHVRADATQLEQAIIHLVVNAGEATEESGRVTISTGITRLERDPTDGDVPIANGPYGWVMVRDTGRGIELDLQGRIFEPFFTTKERGAGTGLGLSAVYGIVKQSGGYTFVESRPGAGAAFTIYLPAVEAPAQTRAVARAESTAPDHAATILLVEDEGALRSLMRRILERRGYEVLEAENGAQAIERCTTYEGAIDLVVSDILMPTMGGREMAARLRVVRPLSRLLFVSGFSDDEAVQEAVLSAGSAYLQKPFLPATLVAKVEEILREPVGGPQQELA
jgi:signal transduction histidine kinase/ActR/RegA family two-component response regulator